MPFDLRSDLTVLEEDKPADAPPGRLEGARPTRAEAAPSGASGWLWPAAIITLFLLAAHGWALFDGLFLDDHLHLLRYADHKWSWQSLLDAATVKPDDFLHSWWQQRTIEWHYTRPFSILLGKIVYQASGGSIIALHAFGLSLHLASSLMVFVLARMLTRRTGWAIIAGLLFVVYSHSVYAVAWLAAQNSVLQTTLTLAAVLAYIKASQLNLYAAPWAGNPLRTDRDPTEPAAQARVSSVELTRGRTSPAPPTAGSSARAGLHHLEVLSDETLAGAEGSVHATLNSRDARDSLRLGWFALTIVLWLLALLSRETAIVLPVIFVALDLAFGGWNHLRQRIRAYLVLAAIGSLFAVWRFSLAYHPIPDFYMRKYDGPEYILWYLAKLMHWVTAAIWLSPMTLGPTGRFNPFREAPWDCLLMLAIIVLMSTGYYLACRRARGWWLWPLWVLLTFLPVVPVMAGPQSGYMAGVGFALAMVLGPALRGHLQPVGIGRWSRPVAIWFLIATCIYIPIYRAMWRSMNTTERFTMAGVAACPPQPRATDLFFINLPFVNVYAQLTALETLNCPDRPLRVHALTCAPNLLRVEYPTTIEQLDASSFRVRMQDGSPYFSGALGRYLLESMRPAGRLQQSEVVTGDRFDVQATMADENGARELIFRFHRPLASPEYCFYVTTNRCGAARLRFWGPRESTAEMQKPADPPGKSGLLTLQAVSDSAANLNAGHAAAAEMLFTAALSDDKKIRELARETLRRVVEPTAQALAAPVQSELSRSDWTPQDLARVAVWWSRHVDDGNLKALLDQREESAAQVWERDRLFRIREIAGRIIQTDLYLTGPPFPSPR